MLGHGVMLHRLFKVSRNRLDRASYDHQRRGAKEEEPFT